MVDGFSRGRDGRDFFSRNEPATYFGWSDYSKKVHQELAGSEEWRAGLSKECLPRGFASGQILAAADASQYVNNVRDAFLLRGQDLFSRFTSAEWLWLIRNTDAVAVCSAIPYLSPGAEIQLFRIAENLIGFSRKSSATIGLTTTPITEALWVARLMSLSACIDRLENLTRRVAKGQKIRVRPQGPPTVVDDPAFERRIQQYDDRHASRVERWYPTDVFSAAGTEGSLLAAFKFYRGWQECDGWQGPLKHRARSRLNGQFTARAWDFTMSGNVDRVAGSLLATSNPVAATSLLLLARATFRLIESDDLNAGETIPKFGVIAVGRQELRSALTNALAEASSDEKWVSFGLTLPEDLEALEGGVESLSQPGMRSAYGSLMHGLPEEAVLIDLNALTWRLGQDLRLSTGLGGPVVKAVADNFELAVQSVVDATSFAPPNATRALRGRQLKLNGQFITDIDAMLVDGNTLLVVSCKRIELGRAYDSGDHARIRAAEDRVTRALDEWGQKTSTLQKNRVGSNYDLSSFDDIVGIVITPELVFTNDERAAEVVQLPTFRVRRLTTIDELADCLEGRVSDATAFRAWMSRRR